MILKELYSIGREMRGQPEWPVELYTYRSIRWEVWLTQDGKLRPPVKEWPQSAEDAVRVEAPDIGRTSNTEPYLIVDDPSYVVGDGNNGAERHAAYMDLLAACAEQVPSVKPIHHYLTEHLGELQDELGKSTAGAGKTKGWINFKVGDIYPADLDDVRRWWKDRVRQELETQYEEPCCLSGNRAKTTRMFPVDVPIAYLQDGRPRQQSCKLVSTDSAAFKSYGLEDRGHAAISFDAAVVAGNALKLIMSDPDTHARLGDVNFAFWTKSRPIRTGLAALVSTDPRDEARMSQMVAFWNSVFSGREYYPPDDKFHVFVLTNTKSRAVIRRSLETSLRTAVANTREWFESLRLAGPGLDMPVLSRLHRAVQVSSKRQDRGVAFALVQTAFFSAPLERPIYASVFPRVISAIGARDAHGNKKSPFWRCPTKEQVSIIKLYLSQQNPEVKELVALNEDFPDIAYHYGRLLAAYEAIQLDASPNVQSTVTERFISAMMVNPKRTVAKLDVLSRAHLRKAGRDKGEGCAVHHSKRLQSINERISALGAAELASMSLDQRGLFVLGYWHEKFKTYNPKKKEDTEDAAGSEDSEQDS